MGVMDFGSESLKSTEVRQLLATEHMPDWCRSSTSVVLR